MDTNKCTYVYKRIGDCSVKADIYFNDAKDAPVIVFIHGGALIWGSREDINPRQVELYREAGFSVVSIDYRLAPETALNSIIEDVQDAIEWICSEGKSKFGLNSDKLAVVGSSAGGYLSLVAGMLSDKPKAIVSLYGYGDILGDWYSKPSEFYCQQTGITREEALHCVGDKILSEGKVERFNYYLYCRQHGIWPQEVSGYDIITDRYKLIELCPAYNVSKKCPPTLLLHGDIDTDVPYMQSVIMTQKLNDTGVYNRLITLEGKGHAFDYNMSDEAVQAAFVDVITFLNKYLA